MQEQIRCISNNQSECAQSSRTYCPMSYVKCSKLLFWCTCFFFAGQKVENMLTVVVLNSGWICLKMFLRHNCVTAALQWLYPNLWQVLNAQLYERSLLLTQRSQCLLTCKSLIIAYWVSPLVSDFLHFPERCPHTKCPQENINGNTKASPQSCRNVFQVFLELMKFPLCVSSDCVFHA